VEILQPKQSVTVKLDGGDARFDCYVRSVAGPITNLGQMGGVVPALRERLTPGSLGYLTWRSPDGGRMALRGVATTAADGGSGLAFVVIEELDLLERRSEPRLALATIARFREIDRHGVAADTVIESITADLSLGGVLVEERDGLEVGARFQLELSFDGFPAPVECEALIVRQAPGHFGIKFTRIDERHRARLAVMLAHYRRRAAAAA
jgi:PilZ domain